MGLLSFPIASESFKHPSQDVNNTRRVNMYTSPAGQFGRGDTQASNFVLRPTAGLHELVSSGGTVVREVINLDDDKQYAIIDNNVYKITINDLAVSASLTLLGTFSSGSSTAPISWARNRTQIMMVNGEANWGYILNYQTDTLTQITDSDFVGGDTVVFVDTYFIYNAPGTQSMYASAINDGTTFDGLDTASAESRADNLVGLLVDKRELLAFGATTIEVWYDAANAAGFPFSVRPGEYYDVGCCAKGSLLNIDNTVFFLDHRRYLTALSDQGLQVLSPTWLRDELASYETVSDAKAYQLQEGGQLMYVVEFPTEGKTWAYDLSTQHWHERAYFNSVSGSYEQHRVKCCVKYKNTFLAGDYANGKLYFYKSDYKTDNGNTIRRLFTNPYLHNQDLLTTINSIYLHGSFGKAEVTGNGSDPLITMTYSSDGGYTWSNELWASLGKVGEYNRRVKWHRLGTQREWTFKFVVVEPIDFTISELGLDIEVNDA